MTTSDHRVWSVCQIACMLFIHLSNSKCHDLAYGTLDEFQKEALPFRNRGITEIDFNSYTYKKHNLGRLIIALWLQVMTTHHAHATILTDLPMFVLELNNEYWYVPTISKHVPMLKQVFVIVIPKEGRGSDNGFKT